VRVVVDPSPTPSRKRPVGVSGPLRNVAPLREADRALRGHPAVRPLAHLPPQHKNNNNTHTHTHRNDCDESNLKAFKELAAARKLGMEKYPMMRTGRTLSGNRRANGTSIRSGKSEPQERGWGVIGAPRRPRRQPRRRRRRSGGRWACRREAHASALRRTT